MEDKTSFMEPLLERAEEYGKTSLELLKLKAVEGSADMISSLVSRSIALLSILLFLLISSIGLAIWLGEITGAMWFGFICVGGFYGITSVLLFFLFHPWIKKAIGNSVVSSILSTPS
ncbi:MAG: hypothetical protein RL204_799 [Bacteroidota bacterium]|jgi:hypothetical protein